MHAFEGDVTCVTCTGYCKDAWGCFIGMHRDSYMEERILYYAEIHRDTGEHTGIHGSTQVQKYAGIHNPDRIHKDTWGFLWVLAR